MNELSDPSVAVVYEFDDVRVHTGLFQVTRMGRFVDLEPKAFDVLILLIRSQGRVVTKQEILERIWADTAVTDNALTRIVAQIRKAIGDDARDAKYVETVPTRGYRWVAEVRVEAASVGAAAPLPPVEAGASSRTRALPFALTLAAVAAVAVAGALAWRTRPVDRRAIPVLRPVQLTVSPALDVFPAFSPDGRFLAYASNDGGGFEIAVRSLASGAEEPAVTADGQQNVQPAWSPDGASIAYHSRRRGGIWIVPARGGEPQQVSPFGSDPAWSPDGQRLAFQSDPFTDILPNGFAANIPSNIWTVDRDRRQPHRLTETGMPIGAHGSPAWSPDGRRIAFVTFAASSPRVWTVPSDGGPPVAVQGLEGARDPVFAPDGAIYAATGGPALKVARISPTTGAAVGEPEQIVVAGLSSARHVAISGDGRRLALASMDLVSQLWTMAVTDGIRTGPPSQLTTDRGRRQSEPAFSPDGSSLAFMSSRRGAGAEIWTLDVGGGRPSPVTIHELFSLRSYTRPTWVRGSREIAFRTDGTSSVLVQKTDLDSRRHTTLVEMPISDGGNRRTFTAPDLTVSPDGSMAAYSQVDPATGRSRLYVRGMSDRAPRAVTDGQSSVRFPVWSPDNRVLAFELKHDDATNIAVVAAAGGPVRLVTSERGESWPYGWSPDGDKILFAALRDGLWNLRWISIRTGDRQQLTENTSASTFVRYPAWSPRGDRIAYELGTVTGNIWVAQLSSASRR